MDIEIRKVLESRAGCMCGYGGGVVPFTSAVPIGKRYGVLMRVPMQRRTTGLIHTESYSGTAIRQKLNSARLMRHLYRVDLIAAIEYLRRERDLIDETIATLEAITVRRSGHSLLPPRRGRPPGSKIKPRLNEPGATEHKAVWRDGRQ